MCHRWGIAGADLNGAAAGMEGVLYKWTNYLSGWQPRWFLLCGGELSYYDSREDAWKGCKGSIQMAVCEIQEFHENTLALKKKMSELRLYCDLLIQQVEKTKEVSLTIVPNTEETTDMSMVLKSTCSTFLKTLEECMQVANLAFTSEALQSGAPPRPLLQLIQPNKMKHHKHSSATIPDRQTEVNCKDLAAKRKAGCPELPLVQNGTVLQLQNDGKGQDKAEDRMAGEKGGEAVEEAHSSLASAEESSIGNLMQRVAEALEEQTAAHREKDRERDCKGLETFFSIMNHRFSDIELQDDDGIPTELFLNSCYAVVPVLDKLGPTIFAPVKMDFVGNIRKINQKFITNKEELTTLQRIVLHELNTNVSQVRNSATEALLWLKRGLKFLKAFLTEVKNGETNIQTALSNAYGKTLRRYHGWVVRGVFALALRASPTYEGFVAALTIREEDALKEGFIDAIKRDLNLYLPAMEKQLNILDTLYEEHGLESDEVV
uniref:Pleckstrin homology domain-containing family A member 8 n=1 Tax=Geotrypetes seraphini TaxID=260995 RepID=A0A6P8PC67_GEOSA|nr:pleckstrin homology domain-containing family A member 8 isoform X2 [Geotrypetes seraphini]